MDQFESPSSTAVMGAPDDTVPPPAGPGGSPARATGVTPRNVGAIVLVAGLAVGAFGLGRVSTEPSTQLASTASSTATPSATGAGTSPISTNEPVADVAAALTPSMVQIETGEGLGSGIVYDTSGLIMTAAHVVGTADQVVVQLADGTRVDGTVLGADTASDVAVVSIQADGLVAAPLALDEELRPGQMAIAIGSPFGLDQTVTAGVISSTSRAIASPNGSVNELIQTDAPINPGNSGGALADREGRVIGINDQIFSQSGGNEGVGFAIPITRAKEIADRLVGGESIETPFLGVTGTDTTLGQAGAVITSVEPGSPAAQAGLQDEDLVIDIDGTPIESFAELAAIIRANQPGDVVTLTLQRGDTTTEVQATLARS